MRRILFSLLLAAMAISASAQTRIALLADLHVSPGNRNSQKLKEVVAEINADPTQIVIAKGLPVLLLLGRTHQGLQQEGMLVSDPSSGKTEEGIR